MNIKYQFIIENEKDESYVEGDKVKIKLNNGEVLIGALESADCLSLTIDRENNSIDIDYEQIEEMEKV